jgi:hypothetical protein
MKAFIYLFAIVILVSCGSEPGERTDGFSQPPGNPEDSLFQAVMDQHDVAMSKMGKLAGYRRQIDQKIDSLKKVKSPGAEDKSRQLTTLGTEITTAEEKMNTWMKEFSIDSAQDNIERRMEYLGSENTKVTKVKDEILAVVAKADSVLGK